MAKHMRRLSVSMPWGVEGIGVLTCDSSDVVIPLDPEETRILKSYNQAQRWHYTETILAKRHGDVVRAWIDGTS